MISDDSEMSRAFRVRFDVEEVVQTDLISRSSLSCDLDHFSLSEISRSEFNVELLDDQSDNCAARYDQYLIDLGTMESAPAEASN